MSAPRPGATPAHAHLLAHSLAAHPPPLPAYAPTPFATASAASTERAHLPLNGRLSGTAKLKHVNLKLLFSLLQDPPTALSPAYGGAQRLTHWCLPPMVTALPLTMTPPDTTVPPSLTESRPSSQCSRLVQLARVEPRAARARAPAPAATDVARQRGRAPAGERGQHVRARARAVTHLDEVIQQHRKHVAIPRALSHSSLQALPALQREREARRARELREEAERELREMCARGADLHRTFTELPDHGPSARARPCPHATGFPT